MRAYLTNRGCAGLVRCSRACSAPRQHRCLQGVEGPARTRSSPLTVYSTHCRFSTHHPVDGGGRSRAARLPPVYVAPRVLIPSSLVLEPPVAGCHWLWDPRPVCETALAVNIWSDESWCNLINWLIVSVTRCCRVSGFYSLDYILVECFLLLVYSVFLFYPCNRLYFDSD